MRLDHVQLERFFEQAFFAHGCQPADQDPDAFRERYEKAYDAMMDEMEKNYCHVVAEVSEYKVKKDGVIEFKGIMRKSQPNLLAIGLMQGSAVEVMLIQGDIEAAIEAKKSKGTTKQTEMSLSEPPKKRGRPRKSSEPEKIDAPLSDSMISDGSLKDKTIQLTDNTALPDFQVGHLFIVTDLVNDSDPIVRGVMVRELRDGAPVGDELFIKVENLIGSFSPFSATEDKEMVSSLITKGNRIRTTSSWDGIPGEVTFEVLRLSQSKKKATIKEIPHDGENYYGPQVPIEIDYETLDQYFALVALD